MCWCFPPHPFQSPQESGGTIAGRSSARDDRAGPGLGEGLPRPASVRAGWGEPAGVLPDRSSGPPFRLFRWLLAAARGLDPGGRGRVVSDNPSLLQGLFPARSYCADARAFVLAKLRHTREKVRGRLPARCRDEPAGRDAIRRLRPGRMRRLRPGKGRALARGQARARRGEEAFLRQNGSRPGCVTRPARSARRPAAPEPAGPHPRAR